MLRIGLLSLLVTLPLFAQTTLRDAGAQRLLLMGAAADSDEFGEPNRLDEPDYAATLGTQYSMLEPENAMKWNPIHPLQDTYNFEPGDNLAAFGATHNMKVRGHNLCWGVYNPDWVNNLAQTASPATMSGVLQDHITTVVSHYKGQVFAWDVVNEAVSDSASGTGTDLKDSIWYDQPGIGLSGTGFIEQAFRWARAADPAALLFYNDYNIEDTGPKFDAVYNMLSDFVSRGVPINGLGIQMHIDTGGYPSSSGLAQNIQRVAALGLQVHITEMDVRIPVDTNGIASSADLQAQADTYQRILTVCIQNPKCTAFQTWGFTDKYSWIPSTFQGLGAALPFDAMYQAKPAVNSIVAALQSVPPVLDAGSIVNAASYHAGAVAPGEIVTIFGVNDGPAALAGAQFDNNHRLSSNLGGTQVFFDGVPAPFIYSLAGQASVIVPFEVAGEQSTVVQYEYNGVKSNSVTVQVTAAAPGVFALNAAGSGQGIVLNNADYSINSTSNPLAAGAVALILATGGGTVMGGSQDGALAPGAANQTLQVTATVGGVPATVIYGGTAPGEVNGVLQVDLYVPSGLASGPQPVVLTVGGVSSQDGITMVVK